VGNYINMIITLTNDKRIEYYLSHFINSPEICEYIVLLKNTIEEKDAYDYHYERWETHASSYYKCFEYNQWKERRPYSYVVDSKRYIAKKDRCLDYYLETGISFQVRDLLLTILSNSNEYFSDYLFGNIEKVRFTVDETSILNKDIKEWRKEDDDIYSVLAQKIMEQFID
jgi:hypothetical protein